MGWTGLPKAISPAERSQIEYDWGRTMDLDVVSIATALLAAGGGGAAVAFGLFRKMGSSWLDAKFAQKLEAFRHDRAKEMERLRAEIDGALRARVRFQERQFDACLEIWNSLKETQSKLLVSISPLQQYSDLRRMSDEARLEYLNSFDLQKWQLEEILKADDIQKSFQKMVDGRRFSDAAKAFSDFDRATRSNELFFEPELYKLLRSICDKMHSSLVAKEIAISESDHKMSREAWTEYDKECVPLVHELVAEMRKILNVRSVAV